jgi:multidrug resistance efflux pump
MNGLPESISAPALPCPAPATLPENSVPTPPPPDPGPARRLRRRRRTAVVGAFLGVALVGGLVWPGLSRGRASHRSWTTQPVHYEKWDAAIETDGDLEPVETSDIICRVRARAHNSTLATTIKWIIADGALVNKGQLLVQLDDGGLQEQLLAERILRDQAGFDVEQAQADHRLLLGQTDTDIEAARTAVALARITLKKYLQAEFPQAREDINNRIEQARERVAYSDRMVKKGFLSRSQAVADRQALDRVAAELRVLPYTRQQTETDLRGKLAEAERTLFRVQKEARTRALQAVQNILVKQQVFQDHESRIHEIEREIRKCTLTAPREGQVVYYSSPQNKWGAGAQQSVIAQGEPVREGQLLMRLPNFSRMQVQVPIHEALINQVQVGARALVRLPAYPGRVFRGHVKQIAGTSSMFRHRIANVVIFQTTVVIDDPFDHFKPNMTARVTIQPEHVPDQILAVPVEAIVSSPERGNHCTCFVDTPDGPEERDIVVGLSNDRIAEVRFGLEEGEEVILEPDSVLADKKPPRPDDDSQTGG